MDISLIKENDFQETAKMIERAVKNPPFSKYYPQGVIDDVAKSLDENSLRNRAKWTHFYVIKEKEKVIACGAIGEYWGRKTESSLFSIFVDPEYQGKGYGRKIIETLEQDEYFKKAKRIEIPASMSEIPFYRKMGYEHKNGQLVYSEGHFALEKFN